MRLQQHAFQAGLSLFVRVCAHVCDMARVTPDTRAGSVCLSLSTDRLCFLMCDMLGEEASSPGD